jgi:putative heme iron utilization protein
MSKPRRHDTTRQRQDPLYDVTIPTPSHAERARTLAARPGHAILATLEEDGSPYASVVLTTLHDHRPVLLVSGLAMHTQNLERDPRCSLLFREADAGNPLALGRLAIQGHARPDDSGSETFLTRHPDARGYAGFGDFSFWSIEVERIRYIGGFGRMSWVDGSSWAEATPDPLDPHVEGIVTHMNDDHADALRAYVAAFSTAGERDDVVMTGIDRYGFEMSVAIEDARRPVRVAFDAPITTPTEARSALVELVKRARSL